MAARLIVGSSYAGADLTLLAGSVARGQANEHSDLDLIVVGFSGAPYRESFMAEGWPVEAFVHSLESIRDFSRQDVERRRPSLPQMISESLLLTGNADFARQLKTEAQRLLINGPPPRTRLERDYSRYSLSDLLDDFAAASFEHALFILPQVLTTFFTFVFDSHNHWHASSKWIPKELERLEPELYQSLVTALSDFHDEQDKRQLITLIDHYLETFGGRYFAGFQQGKHDV